MRLAIVSRRTFQAALAALGALVALGLVSSGAATAVKGPRIVSAVMLDVDGDARADGVRLRYSAAVKHLRDADGRYPFAVAGYRITRVGAASGKLITILLLEKQATDSTARPKVRYRPTKLQPVRDRKGRQAIGQLFPKTVSHGHVPAATPPPPPPPASPPPPAPDTDPDKDGYAAPADCKPNDSAIHPGAADKPDLAFRDTNCDGIDGDEAKSVFVSASGDDANPGTKKAPKRQPQAALAALGARRDVLVAAGDYERTQLDGLPSDIGVYGGYDQKTWTRSLTAKALISGKPEGVFIRNTVGVTLQLLSVSGAAEGPGSSAYGIRALTLLATTPTTRTLTLQKVDVSAGPGSAGVSGTAGLAGRRGADGYPGHPGKCDSGPPGEGGIGGPSPFGRSGGEGGRGGAQGQHSGLPGQPGQKGTPGGVGGSPGALRGGHGKEGKNGSNGGPGQVGRGGVQFLPGLTWSGESGYTGERGIPGNGGGGGGGGAGQGGPFVVDGAGNGGAGGGAGGEGGAGGKGGGPGGGSFGLYLIRGFDVVLEQSSIKTEDGGNGGTGGAGGPGSGGGEGGITNANACLSEIGAGAIGGNGGRGGPGAGGGGGVGGPSIGILREQTKVTLKETTIAFANGGAGGVPGSGGTPNPNGSGPGTAAADMDVT